MASLTVLPIIASLCTLLANNFRTRRRRRGRYPISWSSSSAVVVVVPPLTVVVCSTTRQRLRRGRRRRTLGHRIRIKDHSAVAVAERETSSVAEATTLALYRIRSPCSSRPVRLALKEDSPSLQRSSESATSAGTISDGG